jgi:hypothetical protein
MVHTHTHTQYEQKKKVNVLSMQIHTTPIKCLLYHFIIKLHEFQSKTESNKVLFCVDMFMIQMHTHTVIIFIDAMAIYACDEAKYIYIFEQQQQSHTQQRIQFHSKQKKKAMKTKKAFVVVTIAAILLLLMMIISSSSAENSLMAKEKMLDDETNKYHVLIRETLEESLASVDFYDKSLVFPMMIHDELYTCFLPQQNNKKQHSHQQEEEENKRDKALFQFELDSLVKELNKKCFYRVTGWWIYEVCFNQHIRQYHQDAKSGHITMEYYLGYSRDKNMPQQNYRVHMSPENPEDSYISFHFYDGTICDLTGQQRTAEIRVYCATDIKRQQLLTSSGMIINTQNKISSFVGDIEEPSSCTYVVKYYSNRLCGLKGFAKTKDKISKIQCIPQDIAVST